MNSRLVMVALVLAAIGWFPAPSPAHAAGLELYGTFQSMGVVVTIAGSDDPDWNAVARLAYRVHGSESYQPGLALARVGSERFVGSLFWLQPGISYDVRVTLSDPTGPLDGVTLAGSEATRTEISVPIPAHSYYVSPAGDITDCSLTTPCAFEMGLSRAGPGDEVVLRRGVYFVRNLKLPRSGTPGAPIVIRAYPGEAAVFDGADPAAFDWQPEGGGVWRTTVNVAKTHLVVADGQRLYPYRSLSDLQALSWNLPGFYADGTAVYVRLSGDADPNHSQIAISRSNHALWVNRDYIYILNLTFQHYEQGEGAAAITLWGGENNLVQGSTFTLNDLGVKVANNARDNVIQGNVFYDTMYDWPWDAVKASGRLETGGVALWEPAPDKGGDGEVSRGTIIRRNVFHDMFDGFDVCPPAGVVSSMTDETDVYENLVYRAGDDGMELDGRCSNVRVWRNTLHDLHSGISLAPVRVGPVYVIRNVINRTGAAPRGCDSSFGFSYESPGSGPIYLFHNSAQGGPGCTALKLTEQTDWPLLTTRNNAWVADDARALYHDVNDPVDFDYDELMTSTGSDLVWWHGKTHSTLAGFSAATGQERHGVSVPPGFVDAGGGDLSLQSTSQLIDRGVHIPGINDGHAGAAPDIGAFEYPDSGFTLRITPAVLTIAPGEVATFEIDLHPTGASVGLVTLYLSQSAPGMDAAIDPVEIALPGRVTLTVTHNQSDLGLQPGMWYNLQLYAFGGGFVRMTTASVLVGGSTLDLPVITR